MNFTVAFFSMKMNENDAECFCTGEGTDATLCLMMRVAWGIGNELQLNTGLRVSASGWNPTAQRCRRGSWHGADQSMAAWIINRHLKELERNAGHVLANLKGECSEAEIRHLLMTAIGHDAQGAGMTSARPRYSDQLPLQECMEWYIKEQRLLKGWSRSTQCKLYELTSYLQAFMPSALLRDIDRDWLCRFLSMLEGQGLRNVTIRKMLEMLRWFVRWAIDEQLMTNDAALHFRPLLKSIPRKVVFLSWAELMRVWNLELADNTPLREARDLFCLQCFTSLRYSDVRQLMASQVKDDRIELVTRKTADPLTIELNQYAQEILSWYKGRCEPYAMPQMTVQRANLLLKEIGALAHLDEQIQMVWYVGNSRREEVRAKKDLLSTHCGRRTFICCSLAMGIPAETVMRWTGHSNYRSMKPYIAVADDTKRREMSKWDSWAQQIQDRAPSCI